MSAQTQLSLPRGIDADYSWGPKLFEGGKLYIFKGQSRVVSDKWKSPERTMDFLKKLEAFEFNHMLPQQRQEYMLKKFEALTKSLPTDWTIVICTIASGSIIILSVICKAGQLLSRL